MIRFNEVLSVSQRNVETRVNLALQGQKDQWDRKAHGGSKVSQAHKDMKESVECKAPMGQKDHPDPKAFVGSMGQKGGLALEDHGGNREFEGHMEIKAKEANQEFQGIVVNKGFQDPRERQE